MGENNNDQHVGPTKTDQHQVYGSHQQGRHNLEGASSPGEIPLEEDSYYPSTEQKNRINLQDQGNLDREEDSNDYEMEDEQFDQKQFTIRSQMNEMQEDNRIARVEGDDKDILGETENSRRNQQRMRESESNQDNSQNR